MPKVSWVVALSVLLLAGCDSGETDAEKRARKRAEAKKAYNTPGVVKRAYAQRWCFDWSYPLKLSGRTITFDAPGNIVMAEVRRGDFWQRITVNKTSMTTVRGADAIRFCQIHNYFPNKGIPIHWDMEGSAPRPANNASGVTQPRATQQRRPQFGFDLEKLRAQRERWNREYREKRARRVPRERRRIDYRGRTCPRRLTVTDHLGRRVCP